MSWYDEYKPTIPRDDGLKAKSKRGTFTKNWWATRWINTMETLLDRGRLQRGRRYARKGQVLSLTETNGKMISEVQGSRHKPYKVTIALYPLVTEQWEKVLQNLAERPIFIAELLAGEMPQEIEEAFTAVKLSLFPTSAQQIKQKCSCPDYAVICKHLAAVHYILAERFDEDPFLLFRLRGKDEKEVLQALRQHSQPEAFVEEEMVVHEPAPPLDKELDRFWLMEDSLSQLTTHITQPETPYPVLTRLGPPPFLPDIEKWLRPAYDVVSETAVHTAYPENNPEDNTQNDL